MSDEPQAEVFKYEKPASDKPKDHVRFARTSSLHAEIQVVREDGANNLHSHTGTDGFWMVKRGAARFYTEGDEVIAELAEDEGVLIPHDYPYWFESVGDEDLEILHVASFVEGEDRGRVDHEEHWRKTD